MDKIIKSISAILLLSAVIMITACDQKKVSLPVWLEGNWATGDTLGLSAEAWEVINDEYMSGEGLFILKDNSSVIELLNIFIKDGVLFYAAIVPNQNNGEEIMFMDTQNHPDSLVFENPLHDYPKKIIYHKQNRETVAVYIYGDDDDYQKIILRKVIE
jgi:hypothetical protein